MDEAPITGQDPEPEEQAAEAAAAEHAPEPAAEAPEPELEAAAEPTPEPEPAPEPEPEAEAEPEPEAEAEPEPEAEADQLSLDEMVESLKEPDQVEGEVSPDAPEEPEGPSEVPAPAPDAGTPATSVVEAPVLTRDLLAARLPFGIYVGVWVVFAGVMTYLLWPAASAAFTGLPLYAYFVLGGVALTVLGPLLGLTIWLALRSRADDRAGLARAVFMRAAATTLAGDLVWWLGLVLLDLHRTGVLG